MPLSTISAFEAKVLYYSLRWTLRNKPSKPEMFDALPLKIEGKIFPSQLNFFSSVQISPMLTFELLKTSFLTNISQHNRTHPKSRLSASRLLLVSLGLKAGETKAYVGEIVLQTE